MARECSGFGLWPLGIAAETLTARLMTESQIREQIDANIKLSE